MNFRGCARARGVVVVVVVCVVIVEVVVVEDVMSWLIGFVVMGEDVVVCVWVVMDWLWVRTRVLVRCAKGWEGEMRVEARDDG